MKRKAEVLRDGCVACGSCVKVCPTGAVRVAGGMYAVIDPARCVGCLLCARACPASVIVGKEEGA